MLGEGTGGVHEVLTAASQAGVTRQAVTVVTRQVGGAVTRQVGDAITQACLDMPQTHRCLNTAASVLN